MPDSSASDPSGLKIRSEATIPGSVVRFSNRMPSAPTPVWNAQMASIRAAVRSNGSASASMTT